MGDKVRFVGRALPLQGDWLNRSRPKWPHHYQQLVAGVKLQGLRGPARDCDLIPLGERPRGRDSRRIPLTTPDALQAATAINTGATGLVTNDEMFERLRHFDTLVLDRLL